MKKITVLLSILIASISAFAQVTTTSQITLSSASQGDKVLQIVVADQFSNAKDYSYDAVVGANQAGGLYIIYDAERYTKYATNALGENLAIGFGAVEDLTYTLSFQYFTGESFTIYDKKLEKTITVADNILVNGVAADPANKYTFTIEDEEKNTAINDRFVINYVPAAPVVTTVTTNDYGYASFSWNADLAVPAGLTVYKGVINGSYLDLEPMNYVKAGKGVIVKGAANTTYNFVAGSGDSDYEGNDLRPTSAFDPDDYSNVFVLQGNALYEYTGTTALKANKAYLQLPANVPAPARISFRFNGTTDVENVELEAVMAEKFIENGQVLIRRGEAVYNLQGQMVK